MKVFKKLLSSVLVCVLLLGTLAGCAPAIGEPLVMLENQTITANMFYLYLSRLKGYLTLSGSSGGYGLQAEQDSFWDTLMDASGQTYDDYYTNQLLENVKTYVAALYLFEERGLSLPDETLKAIDEELQQIIDNDFGGSKDALNAELANYGANYDVLREVRIVEEKIALLREDLFGADGSKISAQLKEDYYQQHYRRFKQMFFYTYHFVTEIDEKTGEEKIVTDPSTGYPKTTPMTEKEIQQVIDRVHEAYDKAVVNDTSFLDAWKNGASAQGDFGLFDALLAEKDEKGNYIYNEDMGAQTYTNGYYMTAADSPDTPEVSEALFEMAVGEIRVIRSDEYGFYIIMRYDTDEGAYADDVNAKFFTNFLSNLEDGLLADYLEPYKNRVEVDQALFDSVSMKEITSNLKY